jgi:tetratricopeptide (TPR) repeat protein
LGQSGDHEKAKIAFKKALSLDPRLLEARMQMVIIYLTGGQKQKARAEVEMLREEYPNDREFSLSVGSLRVLMVSTIARCAVLIVWLVLIPAIEY